MGKDRVNKHPRAVILRVVDLWHELSENPTRYRVYFRILKRGRKPCYYTTVLATDELAAVMEVTNSLRERGYRI